MRSLALVTVVAVTCLAAVIHHVTDEASAAATVVPVQQVQSVALDGERGLPLAELRAALETRVGDQLDVARLARDRAALERLLVARGYLAAKVSPAALTFDPRAGASVVFDLARGPMFHVAAVEVTGPRRHLAGFVVLAPGDEAVHARFIRARDALAETLARRDPKATVALTLVPHPDTATVDVLLETR